MLINIEPSFGAKKSHKTAKKTSQKQLDQKPRAGAVQSRALEFAADLGNEVQMTLNLFCWILVFLKFQLVLNSLTPSFYVLSHKAARISLFPGFILAQLGRLYSLTLDAYLRGK